MRWSILLLVVWMSSISFAQSPTKMTAEKGAAGPVHTWKQEPSSFLGIRLLAPLSASVPNCPKEDRYGIEYQKPCFEEVGAFFDVHNLTGRVTVLEANGKVGKISCILKDRYADQVQKALIEKFGPPSTRKTSAIRTKAGVLYERLTLNWNGTNVSIQFDSIGEEADECEVTASTRAYEEEARRRYQKTVEAFRDSF